MFPYPSGSGLHVGHLEGYTATDIVSRYKRMRGFNVLHPMGWDAFGLPAEQYAVKTGIHPAITTAENIATFKRQMKRVGLSYDWEREISTTDPEYYRWTQWIFLKLFERGLAYVAEVPVNWCPALGTVLANEEIVDGKSEVGGFDVVRKPMRQWVLKITAYADRLLEDLKLVEWPASTLEMQKNWIGRSIGAEVDFALAGADRRGSGVHDQAGHACSARPIWCWRLSIRWWTVVTSADQHALRSRPIGRRRRRKSDLQRQELEKEKTGVFTGGYAVNPVNKEPLPIWIADYVLMGYGTGAIMAVPAHDERDWAFAKTYRLPIREVISGGQVEQAAFAETDRGTVVNSTTPDGSFSINGLTPAEAIPKITAWLASRARGARPSTINCGIGSLPASGIGASPFRLCGWMARPVRFRKSSCRYCCRRPTTSNRPGPAKARWQILTEWLTTTDPISGAAGAP